MISPPASATRTRRFPKPRCFSATSRERIGYDHTDTDSETESDDPGQYSLYWLPGLYGGVQIVERPARRHTDFFSGAGYQNPRDLDANNYTLITFNEITTGAKPDWVFGRQLCMHCDQPACASACPTTALYKTPLGPVVFDESRCIGCRACMQACPFIIPKYDYENFAPKIHKCTFCADRLEVGLEPACAKVCLTDAITFGDRDAMVTEAKRRIATAPGTYIPEIYGPKRSAVPVSCIFVGAVRADRLHYRPAEDADARPHASMAAPHGARLRCVVRRCLAR